MHVIDGWLTNKITRIKLRREGTDEAYNPHTTLLQVAKCHNFFKLFNVSFFRLIGTTQNENYKANLCEIYAVWIPWHFLRASEPGFRVYTSQVLSRKLIMSFLESTRATPTNVVASLPEQEPTKLTISWLLKPIGQPVWHNVAPFWENRFDANGEKLIFVKDTFARWFFGKKLSKIPSSRQLRWWWPIFLLSLARWVHIPKWYRSRKSMNQTADRRQRTQPYSNHVSDFQSNEINWF